MGGDVTTSRPRLAVVGSGGIVGFHVAAAREVGFVVDHVAARPGSGSAQRFASEHSIGRVWEDPMDLIAASDGWDAILLATLTDRMPDLLRAACESGKPILAEKPTARHSSLLDEFDRHAERLSSVTTAVFTLRSTISEALSIVADRSRCSVNCQTRLAPRGQSRIDSLRFVSTLCTDSICCDMSLVTSRSVNL